jgi:hypothetical protein
MEHEVLSGSQEIANPLWNVMVHCYVHKGLYWSFNWHMKVVLLWNPKQLIGTKEQY